MKKTHLEKGRERARRIRANWTPAKRVFKDALASDRRFGRSFDLDVDFVEQEICKPCSYCGEDELKRTLDRVDNSIGHLKDNVMVACIRCNYARRDMPIAAWRLLTNGLREARVLGLFGSWTGAIGPSSKRRAVLPKRIPSTHGTRSRYVAGCRCDACREASRIVRRRQRKNNLNA